MKFFYADSQDLVDPNYDFELETRNRDRLRHRDDLYAHQLFTSPCYDGLLVSKGIVDGVGNGSRYTLAQRHRLFRLGVHDFFRAQSLPIIGDCGAFTYVNQKKPPFEVSDVIKFYAECRFDMAMSVDHVILAFQPLWDDGNDVPDEVRERQQLTLTYADEFLRTHAKLKLRFTPIGVAQGWSPKSYAYAVDALQRMGYDYIAIGGMVPLKTPAIIASLDAINAVRHPATRLHLLGVTRTDHVEEFSRFGVVSFDSTSPLRQAFKDDRDNYYTPNGAFTAIRIPQIEANAKLMKRIRSGDVRQERARALERQSLAMMKAFADRSVSLDATLNVLLEYERVYDGKRDHEHAYRKTLTARPWEDCPCEVCIALGHHVIIFRGADRNRRRGFHNLWVFYRRLHDDVGVACEAVS
jgi:Queuine tRNA-ribosyltransferase